MKNANSNKEIFSFNAVTAKECIERCKRLFNEYCTAADITVIHWNRAEHISAVDYSLNYPVVIETDKYYFCLHSFEKFSEEMIYRAFIL